METVKKIVIVDDHDATRVGIFFMISGAPDIEVLRDFSNQKYLFDFLHDETTPNPDIILLDMDFRNESHTEGVEITKKIKNEFNNIEVIIVSANFDNPYFTDEKNDKEKRAGIENSYNIIAEALNAGAKGFIDSKVDGYLKQDIIRGIHCIARGDSYFFNVPVLQTVVEAFLQFAKRKNTKTIAEDNIKTIAEKFNLDEIDLEYLKLLTTGGKVETIANELSLKFNENIPKSERSMIKWINRRQETIAKKLGVLNRVTVILLKAIKVGLIVLE